MGAVFAVARGRGRRASTSCPGRTIALVADRGRPLAELSQLSLSAATVIIGAEREGLPDAVLAAADEVARIPILTDSLNAAMAATVALYEVSRMARDE